MRPCLILGLQALNLIDQINAARGAIARDLLFESINALGQAQSLLGSRRRNKNSSGHEDRCCYTLAQTLIKKKHQLALV